MRAAILLFIVFPAQAAYNASAAEPRRSLHEVRRFSAAEAHQAVAVDRSHVFAINNRSIGKYDKQSGELVSRWQAPKGSPLRHMNSGVVLEGKLYCAHSNWPVSPTSNSIEVFDAGTLKHLHRRDLPGTSGALTWVDRREGHWWIVLAWYGDASQVKRTTLIKLDDAWQRKRSWSFPPQVVARFVPYSNSGGSWGPDGLLYVSGHDRAELYVLRIADQEQQLVLVETLTTAFSGQGFAWDRSESGVVYGIRRQSHEVVALRMSD